MYDINFKDTYKFQPAANYFNDHGVYTKHPIGSPERKAYWDEEERRSLDGFTAPCGGAIKKDIWIPGYFYFYLNFSPIMKLSDEQKIDERFQPNLDKDALEEEINKSALEAFQSDDYSGSIISNYDYNLVADRIEGFPDFWDGDYYVFKYYDVAEKYGKFAALLKRRGVGYSFKTGSMANRNYFLIPGSKTFLIAYEKSQLTGDGVIQKAWDNMNFVNEHTDFRKLSQKRDTELEKRASYIEYEEGRRIEKGYKSEIIGITTRDNPHRVRGIRGKLIVNEELGADPHGLQKWQILKSSVKRDGRSYGLLIGGGTGGTEGASFESLKTLFWKPNAHNVLSVKDIWEDGKQHKDVGMFWPSWLCKEGFMDKDGNSDLKGARAADDAEVEYLKRQGADATTINRHLAENPRTPTEATLVVGKSLLPLHLINEHLNDVMSDPMKRDYGSPGFFYYDKGKLRFKRSDRVKPITDFPHDVNDCEGAVVIYDHPYRLDSYVPRGLYIISLDPYYQDEGPSLACAWVLKMVNNFDKFRMDTIVAEYIGRPKTQDMYHDNLFMLAEYYNAQIAIENDKGKECISYARRRKKLSYLTREFEFEYNTEITKPKNKRGFGMKMASGRNDVVRKIGEQYLSDWLTAERGYDPETGERLLSLHYIYSVRLLKELLEYDGEKNCDGVDSLIIMMYHRMENIESPPKNPKEQQVQSFFTEQRLRAFGQMDKTWY